MLPYQRTEQVIRDHRGSNYRKQLPPGGREKHKEAVEVMKTEKA
jgi:hypothetical protein